MASLNHFILIFSVVKRMLVGLEEFGEDGSAAIDRYADIEREFRSRDDSTDYEIVLIGADSIETIQKTHSHYFGAREVGVPFRELVG